MAEGQGSSEGTCVSRFLRIFRLRRRALPFLVFGVTVCYEAHHFPRRLLEHNRTFMRKKMLVLLVLLRPSKKSPFVSFGLAVGRPADGSTDRQSTSTVPA